LGVTCHPQPDAVGIVALGTLENDPGDGLEVELAEQPFIFADVGVRIRRQDGGQPVLHVQLERGGDLLSNYSKMIKVLRRQQARAFLV
jgi:hypothetical protein